MQVKLKKINGTWDDGWVLDKHTLKSERTGYNSFGHPEFNTIRTEAGEATFLLKNRSDWDQAQPLAEALAANIFPLFGNVGFIVPMPASTPRPRQPVAEVTKALSGLVNRPVFDNILLKNSGQPMKDLTTKAEKLAAIGDGFSVRDSINGDGPWNVLLVDDLFHTGASMESATAALRKYKKVRNIYVAAFTWRPA